MLVIIGFVLTFSMVLLGYILGGGKFAVILEALPHELMTIGGGATGAFMVSNPGPVCKKTLKDLRLIFKGPRFKRRHYIDLLCLMYEMMKLIKMKGMLAIESHIEDAEESELFKKYSSVLDEHHATVLICDTLRLLTMSLTDPYQVTDIVQMQLNNHHHEVSAPARALQTMADGLPAIGIVAAVLGVIKTMSSINQPTEILGAMIGGALVGTFMGVLLAYLLVGPIASKLGFIYDEESKYYNIIRDVIVAHLHSNAPQVSVEMGRANVPGHLQPTFFELEKALNGETAETAQAAPAAS